MHVCNLTYRVPPYTTAVAAAAAAAAAAATATAGAITAASSARDKRVLLASPHTSDLAE